MKKNIKKNDKAPLPLFDSRQFLASQTYPSELFSPDDIKHTHNFLKSYDGSEATFNAYRREVERLLHWSWCISKKSIIELRRTDIEAYLGFCQNPPLSWIGTKKVPRFIEADGKRIANSQWRPFVVTVSKAASRKGVTPDPHCYELSQVALKEIFAILSSFYNFLIQEEYTEVNPVQQIRQRSKFLRKKQGKQKIRRLTELQWDYVITTAEKMAEKEPDKHARTLFIMTALYAMYLRISELASSERWSPKMNDFHRDHEGCWWFTTVGKGNKERQIAVSDAMLNALKRYRQHLGLPLLPSPSDTSPLLPKIKGKGPITNISHIRAIVQFCFDQACTELKADSHFEEAEALVQATVHWLRHTGISDDVKHRPREHVRDDAGHASSAITDKYIDIELRERHGSAKKKPVSINNN
ncbi:MAG: site-specific integrase [Proteobacteria bacterium]|nr:site-specific integrase [Pseudomonadota bacterium]